jgi:hypothetical protein
MWQTAACAQHSIFDTGVDLVLHCSVLCPTSGHDRLLPLSFHNDNAALVNTTPLGAEYAENRANQKGTIK